MVLKYIEDYIIYKHKYIQINFFIGHIVLQIGYEIFYFTYSIASWVKLCNIYGFMFNHTKDVHIKYLLNVSIAFRLGEFS